MRDRRFDPVHLEIIGRFFVPEDGPSEAQFVVHRYCIRCVYSVADPFIYSPWVRSPTLQKETNSFPARAIPAPGRRLGVVSVALWEMNYDDRYCPTNYHEHRKP
jgi:hypothetical protein